MQRGIHPEYRKVCYFDTSTGDEWVAFSSMRASETKVVGGEELPLVRLEISSASHPFWTGQSRQIDAEGRIDRFKRRYTASRRGGTK